MSPELLAVVVAIDGLALQHLAAGGLPAVLTYVDEGVLPQARMMLATRERLSQVMAVEDLRERIASVTACRAKLHAAYEELPAQLRGAA